MTASNQYSERLRLPAVRPRREPNGVRSTSDFEGGRSTLDIIRRKVLGVPAKAENPFSFPQDQLQAMKLRSVLVVVRALGYLSIASNALD